MEASVRVDGVAQVQADTARINMHVQQDDTNDNDHDAHAVRDWEFLFVFLSQGVIALREQGNGGGVGSEDLQ